MTIEGSLQSTALNLKTNTLVELDTYAGFKRISVNTIELRRIENESIRG
jgi:hypothetical protein